MAIHPFGDWIKKMRNPWRTPAIDGFKLWRKHNGERIRMDFAAIPPNSVVLDIGGFAGDWANKVLEAVPSVKLHIVEPHPRFAEQLRRRFKSRRNVIIHEFALAGFDGEIALSDDGDASSSFSENGNSYLVKTSSIGSFFAKLSAERIALAKINIEAAEYELIENLVETGNIEKIDRLQVQFHLFKPEHAQMREHSRELLGPTHICDWAYPFVWEQWSRRSG